MPQVHQSCELRVTVTVALGNQQVAQQLILVGQTPPWVLERLILQLLHGLTADTQQGSAAAAAAAVRPLPSSYPSWKDCWPS